MSPRSKGRIFARPPGRLPPPTLVIVYAWGSINPDELELDPDAPPTQLNTGQMLALVATNKDDLTPGSFDRNHNIPDITEGRHFILVGAYDYASFEPNNPKGKRTILWRARLSVPNSSATLAQSIPALLETGADFFGQDGPSTTLAGKLRQGTVKIGETQVVEEDVRQGANAKAGGNPADKSREAAAKTEAAPGAQ